MPKALPRCESCITICSGNAFSLHHRNLLHLSLAARFDDSEIHARRKRGEIDIERARAAFRKHFRAEEIQNTNFRKYLAARAGVDGGMMTLTGFAGRGAAPPPATSLKRRR